MYIYTYVDKKKNTSWNCEVWRVTTRNYYSWAGWRGGLLSKKTPTDCYRARKSLNIYIYTFIIYTCFIYLLIDLYYLYYSLHYLFCYSFMYIIYLLIYLFIYLFIPIPLRCRSVQSIHMVPDPERSWQAGSHIGWGVLDLGKTNV